MQRIEKNELEQRVDEVLYYKWDPIGVNDSPETRAEYRSYVPKIIELLNSTGDSKKIAQHLDKLSNETMGLGSNLEFSNEIAQLLLRHKEAIEDGKA